MRLPWRHAAVTAGLSLAVVAGYLHLRDAPLFAALEAQTLGWRFQLRGPVAPPEGVTIVALDDRTIAHANTWPLPRRMLADAVRRVHEAGATAIGIDLLLLEPEPSGDGLSPSAGDRALRAALAEAGDPVLGMAFTFGPGNEPAPETVAALAPAAFAVVRRQADGAGAGLPRATGALVPAASLREVASLGHVNVPVDERGTLHRLPLAIAFDELYLPGFPVVLAARYLDLDRDAVALHLGRGPALGGGLLSAGVTLGARRIAADPALRLVLDYYGPSGTIPTFSLLDVLERRLPADALAGRAVLLGPTALGVGDTFATPYDGALPGVEVLATATANLTSGQVIARTATTAAIDVAAILLIGLATFLLAQLPSAASAVGAALALLAGWLVVAQLAFQTQLLWLDVIFPSLAVLLNAGWIAVARLVFERRLRGVAERQRHNLSRYHSPLIADFLADGAATRLDGEEQPAAILFIDIAGFTGRSARIGPAATARFLRDFHARVEHTVLRHGGVLEQFTGDGAMVIFGVPHPREADAAAALACGRDLVAAIGAWNAELAGSDQPPVSIGVGIHFGPVVIARLGGDSQFQLTAAGDTVNLASRLEALTRAHGAAIVVSSALATAVEGLGRHDLLAGFEEVASQAIRGRDLPVDVWILRQLPA